MAQVGPRSNVSSFLWNVCRAYSREAAVGTRPSASALLLSLLKAIDAAQGRLVSFVQPDEHAPVWGVNPFAELSVPGEAEDHVAGRQMGLLVPVLSGWVGRWTRACGLLSRAETSR